MAASDTYVPHLASTAIESAFSLGREGTLALDSERGLRFRD